MLVFAVRSPEARGAQVVEFGFGVAPPIRAKMCDRLRTRNKHKASGVCAKPAILFLGEHRGCFPRKACVSLRQPRRVEKIIFS